jgi:hypothetical protein
MKMDIFTAFVFNHIARLSFIFPPAFFRHQPIRSYLTRLLSTTCIFARFLPSVANTFCFWYIAREACGTVFWAIPLGSPDASFVALAHSQWPESPARSYDDASQRLPSVLPIAPSADARWHHNSSGLLPRFIL